MDRKIGMTGLRGFLLAAALPLLLAGPAVAQAQKPAVGAQPTKRGSYGAWDLLCQGQTCAIAHRTVRAVLVFGNSSDGGMAMEIRLPTDAPQGRPVAMRLHKSGTVLNLRVNDCFPTFCRALAAGSKTEQVIELFSKEPGGTLGYQLAQDMQLEVFSLNGFTKAIEELRKLKPSAQAKPKK
jgi:invasion protein IalB